MKMTGNYPAVFDRIAIAVTLADLIDRGYKQKFRREPAGLCCDELYEWYAPDQFTVDEWYAFGAALSPDVERRLYAITTRSGLKGTLLDTQGVYADNMSMHLFQKLRPGTVAAHLPVKTLSKII